MAAEVKEAHNNYSKLPFMCGICLEKYKTIEQFNLHLQSHNIHISEQLHTCLDTDEEIDQDRFIHCKLCSNRFKTLCTFHDHLTQCGGSGSYIFHYQTFQAYPLSELCAFFENREVLQTELRDRIIDEIELNQCRKVLKDYVDALNDLIYLERNNTIKSGHIVCDAATQTLSIEDIETQLVNMPTEMSDSEDSYSFRKRTRGKALTAQKSIAKPQTRTRTKSLKIADKHKRSRGRKRKVIDKDANNSEQCKAYCEPEESPELILIKTENSDTEEQAEDNISETISENNEKNEFEDKLEYDSFSMGHKPLNNSVVDTQIRFAKEDITSDTIKSVERDNQLESVKATSAASAKLNDNSKQARISTKKSIWNSSKPSNVLTEETKMKATDLSACDVCGKEMQNYKMKEHKVSHSDVRAYACDLCPKTYKHKVHLNIHKAKHEKTLPYCCEICGQGFVLPSALRTHQLYHRDNSERPFKCEVCGYGFISHASMARHMVKHTGDKKVQCDLCGMRFMQNHNLTSHISRVHRKEKKYECAECDQRFYTNYQLKCHVLKHKGLRPYKCTMCAADYIERKTLRKHMKKVHQVNFDELNIAEPKDDMSLDKVEIPKNSLLGCQTSHDEVSKSNLPFPTEDNQMDQSIVVLVSEGRISHKNDM